jgi:hypothetical protein
MEDAPHIQSRQVWAFADIGLIISGTWKEGAWNIDDVACRESIT